MGSKPGRKRTRQDAPANTKKRVKRPASTSMPSRVVPPPGTSPAGHIHALDDIALLRITQLAGYQARLTAMQVCKRWKGVAQHPRFTHKVKPGHSIMSAVRKAKAGDTLLVPPGFYDEMLLFEKPIRVIGMPGERVRGGKRRGVVLQSSRSVVALCNARCCFKDLVFRSEICTTDRAICCYGADGQYMRFENCEFGGFEGLQVPAIKGDDCKLILLDCYIHGVGGPKPAVLMEAGFLRMEGCTVTNCVIGLDIFQQAVVFVKNNDISFNESAMILEGRGVVANNVFWGNLRRNALEVSIENLDHMSTVHNEKVPVLEDLLAEGAAAANQPEEIVSRFLANSSNVDLPDIEAPVSMQRVHISGNHLLPSRNQNLSRSTEEKAVRRQVRRLAAATYGPHEHELDDWPGSEEDSDSDDDESLGSDWSDEDDDEEGDDDIEEYDEHGVMVDVPHWDPHDDWVDGPHWDPHDDWDEAHMNDDDSSDEDGSDEENDDLSSLEDAMQPDPDALDDAMHDVPAEANGPPP